MGLLGDQAIDRMLEDPVWLLLEQIPGLNESKRKNDYLIRFDSIMGMDQVIVGLSRYGFGSQLSFAFTKHTKMKH